MLPAKFSCPRCKCHALYQTRRRGVDWLMSAIGLRPVRCMTCEKRFYMRHSWLKGYEEPPNRVYVRPRRDAGKAQGATKPSR
jgi:hypothetical protein